MCMSIFPGTGSQNEFFPYVPPAAFSNGELEGRSPSKMQGGSGGGAAPPGCFTFSYAYTVFPDTQVIRMVGPSVFPDTRVLKMLGPSVFPDSQGEVGPKIRKFKILTKNRDF